MSIFRVVCIAALLISGSIGVGALESEQLKAWEADLDFLLAEFPKVEGGLTAEERAAFEAKVEEVRVGLATIDEEHVIAGVMQAVAEARNGHTGAYPARGDARYGRVPMRLWYFADGIYVVKARPEQAHLLGAKLTAIGGHDIADVIERVGTLAYGNRSWKKYIPTVRLSVPALLYGVDVSSTVDRAEYGFVKADGSAVREPLTAEAPDGKDYEHLSIWDLAPKSQTKDGEWKYAFSDTSERAPLYLREPNRTLWYEYLKKSKTFYIQYNASYFMQSDDRHALITGMLEGIEKERPKRVIVDLRLNGGGDLSQMRGAFNRMLREEALQKPGSLFVITGQSTFSAGLFHAANLKQQGATVVGDLVGDDIDFWAEGGGALELPNSKMRIGAATGFHSYAKIEHPEWKDKLYLDLSIDTLEPDVPVGMTFADYVRGRDPLLAAISGE